MVGTNKSSVLINAEFHTRVARFALMVLLQQQLPNITFWGDVPLY